MNLQDKVELLRKIAAENGITDTDIRENSQKIINEIKFKELTILAMIFIDDVLKIGPEVCPDTRMLMLHWLEVIFTRLNKLDPTDVTTKTTLDQLRKTQVNILKFVMQEVLNNESDKGTPGTDTTGTGTSDDWIRNVLSQVTPKGSA